MFVLSYQIRFYRSYNTTNSFGRCWLFGEKVSQHTLLFLSCFVTNGRSQLKFGPVWERAVSWTHHHTKTWLLQDLTVMIVSVPHGPSAQVSLCVLIFTAVYITYISIRPLLERIILLRVLEKVTIFRCLFCERTSTAIQKCGQTYRNYKMPFV